MLLHQCFRALDAMNVVEIDKVARSSTRGESQCEFCGRPWFGLVAYCPYCGRKASVTAINQGPDDRLQGDAASASGEGLSGMPAGISGMPAGIAGMPAGISEMPAGIARMPAGEPHRQAAKSPPKEPRATPLLFKILAAGVSLLLLLWMAVKLPAPKTTEEASPQPPISASSIAPPRRGASTSTAQAPSIPPRTDTAVPVPVPPQSNRSSLCSVANEAAGLCKSQK